MTVQPLLRLCVSNGEAPKVGASLRAFAVKIGKDCRIVRAARHEVGRFTFYRTASAEALALSLEPLERSFPVPLRWNLDEGGEAHLEEVFRHKGRMVALQEWLRPPG